MIILQRLSYFIFAVFVSTLFVYLLHRTFTPNDIINIPVLAIIIYLIINYSAEITYEKNLEKFLNQHSESSISDMMENFDGAGSSLLKRLSAFSEEEEDNRQQNEGDQSIILPESQIQTEKENKMSVPEPTIFKQEEVLPTVYKSKQKPQPEQNEEVLPTVYKSKQKPQAQQNEEEILPTVYQAQPQAQQNEEEILPTVYQSQPQPQQNEEEVLLTVYQAQPQPQEEGNKYYNIVEKKNPKEEQAKKKEYKRPNINKYLENKNHEMNNKLYRSVQPININVSYNNPVALNKFNNPDTNKFRFDSGLDFGLGSGLGFGMGSGFDKNDSFYNENNTDLNSTYYPSYLNNPLNYNVGGTQIPAIRQESNYEQDRQKQILTEKNNPSPVMFGDEWSEWAPV